MKNKLSEIKISYSNPTSTSSVKVQGSEDARSILFQNWDHDTIELQEEFKVLLLNRASKVLGIYSLSKGGMGGTVVDAKILFATALKCLASSIILAHNHPSGSLRPSQVDITLTQKLKEAGKLLDITVLDHIILTKDSYYSFADDGLM